MSRAVEVLLILILATDLRLLGGSRVGALIRTSAFQGVLLGLLPLVGRPEGTATVHLVLLAAGMFLVKGVVLPRLLRHAQLSAGVGREVDPIVGFTPSTLIGLAGLGASLWIGQRLPLPNPSLSPLIVPTSLFTIMTGLFLVVSRRKALTQVLGYLVFENGIFAFGIAVAAEQPLLVEIGVLLDVFVAVFVMGIIIFHIRREFDHIDVSKMRSLRDVTLRIDRMERP